jgi:hypothetical protein
MLISGELGVFGKPDPLDGPYFEESFHITPSRRETAMLTNPATRQTRPALVMDCETVQ